MNITGNIDGLKKGTLYLQTEKDSLVVNLDSVNLKGSGNYKLGTNIVEPDIYYLYLDKKDIGILVTKELRHRWKLFDKGDEINLPIILKQINEIDIVYYDSGKSYSGKKIFFDKINLEDRESFISFIGGK